MSLPRQSGWMGLLFIGICVGLYLPCGIVFDVLFSPRVVMPMCFEFFNCCSHLTGLLVGAASFAERRRGIYIMSKTCV